MAVLVARRQNAGPDGEFEIYGTCSDQQYLVDGADEWDEYIIRVVVELTDTDEDIEV